MNREYAIKTETELNLSNNKYINILPQKLCPVILSTIKILMMIKISCTIFANKKIKLRV